MLMLERGAFDDVTVAMMVHPFPVDITDPRGSSNAVGRFEVTFTGRASHAAAAPEGGLNAADAAVVAQVAVGQLRQQLRTGTGCPGSSVSAGSVRTSSPSGRCSSTRCAPPPARNSPICGNGC